MNITIDPVDLMIFIWYARWFFGLFVVGGVIAWLFRAPLEFIGEWIVEGPE